MIDSTQTTELHLVKGWGKELPRILSRKSLLMSALKGVTLKCFSFSVFFLLPSYIYIYSTKDITDHILLCKWPQQFTNLLFCFSTVVVAIVGATPIQGCLFQWAKTRPSLCYQVSSSVFIFLLILQWQQLVGQKVDLSVSLLSVKGSGRKRNFQG